MATRPDPSDGVAQLTELLREVPPTGRARVPDAPAAVDPETRRRLRRRRAITGGISAGVVVALIAAYVGYALTAPLAPPAGAASPPPAVSGPAAAVALPPDGVSAISVAGGDGYLGAEASGIWMGDGIDEVRPMASISKLITAMVVLEAKPLAGVDDPGPTLTFDKDDHALYDKYYVLGATIAPMPTGSSMSLHDALEAMLVVSACNYAEAVAEWAFGSQWAFLAATKTWLAKQGLAHTTMVEPTGVDARNVTTPSDLIALGKLAMANPVIAEIVAAERLDAPGLEGMWATNTLLGEYGIRGIKTGTLGPDASNLLFSAELGVGLDEPLDVTGVVLGGFSHETVDRDVTALLASIQAGFHSVAVAEKGRELGSYTTPWGASARMVLADDASLYTWSNTPIEVTMTPVRSSTGRAGEQLGTVTWTAGPQSVTVPIVLDATIEQPDAWWRLTHPFELGE